MIDVGVADFGDVTEVRLLDGIILLARDGVILPPQVTLGGAPDTAQERFKSSTLGMGMNVFSQTPYLNYNQSQSRSDQTTHRNAVILITNPDGVLDASRTKSLNLEGGQIVAPYACGFIDDVKVTTYQDEKKSSQWGFGFDLGYSQDRGMRGGVQGSAGKAHEKIAKNHAGISIQSRTLNSILSWRLWHNT